MADTPTYRVLAADVQTGKVITELRVASVSYECALNNVGAFTATIPLAGLDQSQAAQQVAGTSPGRTAIYIVRNNVIVWGGVLWGRRYKTTDRALLIDGREILSLFGKRETFDLNPGLLGVLACDVVRWAIDQTQYQNEALLSWANPTFNPPDQAVLTDVWLLEDARSAYAAVLSAAVREGGPDVWTTAEFVDGTYIRNVIHLGNDVASLSAGRSVAESGLEFLLGEDAGEVEVTEDASVVTNRVSAFAVIPEGSPTGTRPEQAMLDTTQPINGFPIMVGWYSSRAEGTTSLIAAARREADQGRFPRATVTATLRPNGRYGVGDYGLGDEATLRLPSGVDPRFPDGLTTEARVAAFTVTFDGRGVEGLTPSLEFGGVIL